jgi:hypothetical protein
MLFLPLTIQILLFLRVNQEGDIKKNTFGKVRNLVKGVFLKSIYFALKSL